MKSLRLLLVLDNIDRRYERKHCAITHVVRTFSRNLCYQIVIRQIFVLASYR